MSSEIPEKWTRAILGDVAKLIMGQSPPSSAVSVEGDGLPFIQGNAEFGARYPSPHLVTNLTPKSVMAGDILLSVRAPVGEVNVAEGPLCIGRGIAGIRATVSDSDFLFYVVRGLSATLARLSQGSTFDAINGRELRTIELLIPPFDEQQRIAEVLRSIDEAIMASSFASTQATRSFDRVLSMLFDPYASGDAQPGAVRMQVLSACERVTYGFTNPMPTTDTGPWMITATNVKNGRIDYSNARHTSVAAYENLTDKSRPRCGSVLVTKDGTLGRIAIVDRDDICVNQSVAVLTPKVDLITSEFLSYLLQSECAQSRMLADSGGGSVKHIYITKLAAMSISVPSVEGQQIMVDEVQRCQAVAKMCEASLRQLKEIRKLISSDLLTGRVRVPAASLARTVQPAFKRAAFAAEIVYQLHQDARFGSVKHEKIVYLCELHAGLHDDLDRHAYKKAAGPYDPKARRSVETIFKQQKWFRVARPDGKRVVYQALEKCGGHAVYFQRYFGDRKSEIQPIIDLLRPMRTEQCEIVATLYAVWNDFLIDGIDASDEQIVESVLNDWHPSKAQIEKDRWLKALPWMRENGLVPRGSGEKTRTVSV